MLAGFGHMRPAKVQISLGIRAVWSEPFMCALWISKDATFLHLHNEDRSDCTGARAEFKFSLGTYKCQMLRFLTLRLNCIRAFFTKPLVNVRRCGRCRLIFHESNHGLYCLIPFKLNKLPHTIYWKCPISSLGIPVYVI